MSFVGSVAVAYGVAHIGKWYGKTNHQDTYTLHLEKISELTYLLL